MIAEDGGLPYRLNKTAATQSGSGCFGCKNDKKHCKIGKTYPLRYAATVCYTVLERRDVYVLCYHR